MNITGKLVVAAVTHGHETNRFEIPYLEGIATALEPAGQILLVGHGKGKIQFEVDLDSTS